jgi:hypothetical protein
MRPGHSGVTIGHATTHRRGMKCGDTSHRRGVECGSTAVPATASHPAVPASAATAAMESTEATTATMTPASAAARQSGAGHQQAQRCGCQQRDHHFA